MTDPIRPQEIEDVLSTIRRLVADERPLPLRLGAREGAVPVTGSPAPSGRAGAPLLLTESLRVVAGADSAMSAPGVSDAPHGGLQVATGDTPDDPAPAAHEVRDLRALFAVAARNAAQVGEPAPMAEWEEEDPDTDCDVTPLPFVTRRRILRPSGGAAVTPATAASDAGPHPEATAQSAPPSGHETPPGPSAATNQAGGTGAGAAEELSDVTAVSVMPSSPDRELLRELVREILIAELSGPLGERITRNLRRLARAEANRAIATRDLG